MERIIGTSQRKKPPAKAVNTGSFALQGMNGISLIVSFRSLSFSEVRLAMTAGTEQPNPIRSGTTLLPFKPIFRNGASSTNAIRAI